MTNIEFFYLANEQAKRIASIQDFLFGGLAPTGGGEFYFLAIGLEYMVSAHLAEITNQTGCDLDEFSEVSLKKLDAENEKEIDKIVSDCIAEYTND